MRPHVYPVARTCNLIFIVCERAFVQPTTIYPFALRLKVLDVLKPLLDKAIIESELEGFGIRLNKRPPSIIVRKKDKGGALNHHFHR